MIKSVFYNLISDLGSDWINSEEKAMPLKLFFTDQSKVSTSAGPENSVVQIIGKILEIYLCMNIL